MTASDPDLTLVHAEYARLTADESAELRRQTARVSAFAVLTAVVVPVVGFLLGGQILTGAQVDGLTWAAWLLVVPAVALGVTTFVSLSLTAADADDVEQARQRLRQAVAASPNPAAALVVSSFAAMRGSRRSEIGRLALVIAVCDAILVGIAAMTSFTGMFALLVAAAMTLGLHALLWATSRPSALPPEWRAAFLAED